VKLPNLSNPTVIRQACPIALRDLRACYNPAGSVPGGCASMPTGAGRCLRLIWGVGCRRHRAGQCAPATRSIRSGRVSRSISWPGIRDSAAVADLARIGAWYAARTAAAEVYDPGGMMLNRRFYQAEAPCAWNAGVYTYALHTLGPVRGEIIRPACASV